MTRAAVVEKRESEIKDAFWRRFEELYAAPYYFVMQLQDVRNGGHPDNCVNGYGRSTWWEFKHATPNFSSPGLQELTCVRLAKHSYCRYVLFYEHRDESKTLITHPRYVHQKHGKLADIHIEVEFAGHNFDQLAAYIHAVHFPQHYRDADA